MATAYLSLGSSAVDARERLSEAEARLGRTSSLRLVSYSATASVGGRTDDRPSLYRVVGIETSIKPRALLEVLIATEAGMGRDHADVWGTRLIDIDLIAYDEIEIRSSRLQLPHAFAHSRPFIIGPLREIAPAVASWVAAVATKPR